MLSRGAQQPTFEEHVAVELSRGLLDTAQVRVPDGRGGDGKIDVPLITAFCEASAMRRARRCSAEMQSRDSTLFAQNLVSSEPPAAPFSEPPSLTYQRARHGRRESERSASIAH